MASLSNNAWLCLRYLAVSVRAQMQYRVSTWMSVGGLLVITTLEYASVWVLFCRFGTLRGWNLAEIAVLYGMASASFAIAEAFGRGFSGFARFVLTGEFDRILVRPRSAALQVAAQEMHLMPVGRLVQGIAVLWWGGAVLQVSWSLAKVALACAGIVGGACVFLGIFVAQATLTFWTTQSLEIAATVTNGGLEAAQFPLSIYDDWMRQLFTYVVPLACMNFLPGLVLMERVAPGSVAAYVGWCAPAVGPVFLASSFELWKRGVRHYRSAGA